MQTIDSWIVLGGNQLAKKLDKSAFVFRSIIVPLEVQDFFHITRAKAKYPKHIKLMLNNTAFDAFLEISNGTEIRLFWSLSFADLLRKNFPSFYSNADKGRKIEGPYMIFYKSEDIDAFQVSFKDEIKSSNNREKYTIKAARKALCQQLRIEYGWKELELNDTWIESQSIRVATLFSRDEGNQWTYGLPHHYLSWDIYTAFILEHENVYNYLLLKPEELKTLVKRCNVGSRFIFTIVKEENTYSFQQYPEFNISNKVKSIDPKQSKTDFSQEAKSDFSVKNPRIEIILDNKVTEKKETSNEILDEDKTLSIKHFDKIDNVISNLIDDFSNMKSALKKEISETLMTDNFDRAKSSVNQVQSIDLIYSKLLEVNDMWNKLKNS